MSVVISVEGVSKQYRLGVISATKLSHEVAEWWRRWRSPEAVSQPEKDVVWALRDVSFEVKRGEVLGIIGRNGAGKSTLLKILARVTAPTEGVVRMKGRIASLLEVGTGFHPELTGRDNIYLNGAILGMKRGEIARKFDEIVAFSGVEKYIDTPVKRYSSGMYMRLAFAVAAHLDPEILVVDEVLAVGDADFQRKCLGKMKSISESEGRTVLFVSHNMTAVKSLCTRAVSLNGGRVVRNGAVEEVVSSYLHQTVQQGTKNNEWKFEEAPGTDIIKVKSAYVRFEGDILTVKTPFEIITEFWCLKNDFELNVSMHLFDGQDQIVFAISSKCKTIPKGLHQVVFPIPAHFMNDGLYQVSNMYVSQEQCHYFHRQANSFEILEERESGSWHGKWPGVVRPTFIQSEFRQLSGTLGD